MIPSLPSDIERKGRILDLITSLALTLSFDADYLTTSVPSQPKYSVMITKSVLNDGLIVMGFTRAY